MPTIDVAVRRTSVVSQRPFEEIVRRLTATIGHPETDVFLSRNTHPSNSGGLPGISLPMAVNAEGLPLGLELDAAAGRDRDLLALARRVERVVGRVPRPPGEDLRHDHTTHQRSYV